MKSSTKGWNPGFFMNSAKLKLQRRNLRTMNQNTMTSSEAEGGDDVRFQSYNLLKGTWSRFFS